MFGLVGGVVSLIHFEDSAGLAFGVVCLLGAPVWFVAGRAGMPARIPPDNHRFGVTVFGVMFGMVCLVVGLGFGLGVVVEWWFLVGAAAGLVVSGRLTHMYWESRQAYERGEVV